MMFFILSATYFLSPAQKYWLHRTGLADAKHAIVKLDETTPFVGPEFQCYKKALEEYGITGEINGTRQACWEANKPPPFMRELAFFGGLTHMEKELLKCKESNFM